MPLDIMEYINTYLLNDPAKRLLPMERAAFYDEQFALGKEGGEPTRSVDIVQIILFTTDGEIVLQSRAANKKHNPSMIDKSVGGHITVGDTPDHSAMIETVQELDVPSFVVQHNDSFERYYALLQPYLSTIALLKFIDCKTHTFQKKYNGQMLPISNRYHLYFGFYNGKAKNNDREARGVLYYSLEELHREIEQSPTMFTHDLTYFLQRYSHEIQDFLAYARRK